MFPLPVQVSLRRERRLLVRRNYHKPGKPKDDAFPLFGLFMYALFKFPERIFELIF